MNETIRTIIENAVIIAVSKNLITVQDTEDQTAAVEDFYDTIKENVNIMVENDINNFGHLLYVCTNDFLAIYDNIEDFTKSTIFKNMISSIYEYYFC